MEKLKEVLTEYHIFPLSIERVTNRLYKVTTDRNSYALKRTNMSNDELHHWNQVYYLADKHHLHSIIPIYVTKNHQFVVVQDDEIYYLCPWIADEDKEKSMTLLDRLSKIHQKTKTTKTIDVEQFQNQLNQYKENSEQVKENLIKMLENFEQKQYKSPIELQFCTHFHRLMAAQEMIKTICDQCNKSEDLREWSVSLCHGNVCTDHFLMNSRQQLFINWEKASFNYPIYDLITFYQQEAKKSTESKERLLEGFKKYDETMKLTDKEKYFLILYLLDPSNYLKRIKRVTERKPDSILDESIKIEQQYRIMKFGITLFSFVMKKVD